MSALCKHNYKTTNHAHKLTLNTQRHDLTLDLQVLEVQWETQHGQQEVHARLAQLHVGNLLTHSAQHTQRDISQSSPAATYNVNQKNTT